MTPDEARGIARVLYRGRVDSHGIPEYDHMQAVARNVNYGDMLEAKRTDWRDTLLFMGD